MALKYVKTKKLLNFKLNHTKDIGHSNSVQYWGINTLVVKAHTFLTSHKTSNTVLFTAQLPAKCLLCRLRMTPNVWWTVEGKQVWVGSQVDLAAIPCGELNNAVIKWSSQLMFMHWQRIKRSLVVYPPYHQQSILCSSHTQIIRFWFKILGVQSEAAETQGAGGLAWWCHGSVAGWRPNKKIGNNSLD